MTIDDLPRMQVSEVRRCLSLVRRHWDEHAPDAPMLLSGMLPNNMMISDFCFVFVVGHHTKRHVKSAKKSP